jgi:DHA1 family bicyclomycin/chloramphenicol resistance-like MFS transporter
MVTASMLWPSFLPFLCSVCVFLLGMGIVNPLGTAQALSPFGKKAGAASALLGFWQMIGAASGVLLAAHMSDDATFSLALVLTAFSAFALGIYTMRAKSA